MAAKRIAASAEQIAVYEAFAALIASERETLWARHNALLLANSLIIGALAVSPAALWQNKWGAVAMLCVGLIVSAAWFGIAVQSWTALRRRAELASTFASSCFADLPDPFAEAASGRAQANLHRLVLLVIAVFMVMYLALGLVRLFSA